VTQTGLSVPKVSNLNEPSELAAKSVQLTKSSLAFDKV
jgi:hypothetical protein